MCRVSNSTAKVVKYDSLCGFLFLGWALHYLPFASRHFPFVHWPP